jgi:hypothetical protein
MHDGFHNSEAQILNSFAKDMLTMKAAGAYINVEVNHLMSANEFKKLYTFLHFWYKCLGILTTVVKMYDSFYASVFSSAV